MTADEISRLKKRLDFVGDTGTLGHVDPALLRSLLDALEQSQAALAEAEAKGEHYSNSCLISIDHATVLMHENTALRARLEAAEKALDAVSYGQGVGDALYQNWHAIRACAAPAKMEKSC